MTMTTTNDDDTARRAYWAEQMELGYAVVQQLISFPVNECGERFASLRDAAAEAKVEMLFSTTKIAGDLDRVYSMRESLVHDVITIGREMNERGWILKIEEGFRSQEMQRQLVRKPVLFDAILKKCIWENGGEVPSVEMVFRRAIVLIANIPKIGTHMHFPFEFWYFNKGDAGAHILTGNPAPARYGPVNWNPQTNEVTPVADPLTPLNPLPVIEKEVAAAMQRAAAGDRMIKLR